VECISKGHGIGVPNVRRPAFAGDACCVFAVRGDPSALQPSAPGSPASELFSELFLDSHAVDSSSDDADVENPADVEGGDEAMTIKSRTKASSMTLIVSERT
jgi:hypothetical protein